MFSRIPFFLIFQSMIQTILTTPSYRSHKPRRALIYCFISILNKNDQLNSQTGVKRIVSRIVYQIEFLILVIFRGAFSKKCQFEILSSHPWRDCKPKPRDIFLHPSSELVALVLSGPFSSLFLSCIITFRSTLLSFMVPFVSFWCLAGQVLLFRLFQRGHKVLSWLRVNKR